MARLRKYEESGRQYTGCWYYESDNDRTYYCTYRKDGKLITAKHGQKSKGYNLRGCSELRADLLRGKVKNRQEKRIEAQQKEAVQIEALYQKYLTDKKGKGRDDSRFYKRILPYWKKKDISLATNPDVAKFKVYLESQESERGGSLSPQSIKHDLAMFRRILNHAKRHINGFTLQIDNYAIPEVDNEVTEDLKEEQFARLINVLQTDTVNRPVCDMMLLMLATGMRRGEVLKLMWQNVNNERGTILLKQPKGGTDVTIPMSSGARAVLSKQKKTSMYVFPGVNGKKRLHIDKQARRIRDLAGLPKDFRPCHGLRHYFGTELASKGTSIVVISALLGHKSIAITQRYLNARDEQKQKAVELMDIGGKK